MKTSTAAVFSHLADIQSLDCFLPAEAWPYRPELAAVHHLLPNGWLWQLPFADGRQSWGRVFDLRRKPQRSLFEACSRFVSQQRVWEQPAPSVALTLDIAGNTFVNEVMRKAKVASPPGRFIAMPRVQHRWQKSESIPNGFYPLPTTLATIDPLHSTGLGHALSGAQRVAELVQQDSAERTQNFLRQVENEIDLMDQVVSTAYACLHDSKHFFSACMLYFALAIADEEQRTSEGFRVERSTWRADSAQVRQLANRGCQILEQEVALNRPEIAEEFDAILAQLCEVPLNCRDDKY